MAKNKATTAEVDKEIRGGKTVISIAAPSPKWATWMFRVVFLLTTAITPIIASEDGLTDVQKVKIFLYLKGFDFVFWGIARGLGVEKKSFEESDK